MADARTPFAARTAGALEGLVEAGIGELGSDELAVALSAVGDGVRLELLFPDDLRTALRKLPEQTVLAAVASLAAEPSTWSLPVQLPASGEVDPGLAWALRRRDEIESALVASRVTLAPRRTFVDATTEAAALREALAPVDLTCGGIVPRGVADAHLGERLEIAAAADWLERAAWAEEPEDSPATDEVEEALGRHVVPSHRFLERYVVHGELAAWVEAAARRCAPLATDLAAMIATYREHRARVSWRARLWERDHDARHADRPRASGAIVFAAPSPDLRRAAADAAGIPEENYIEHELGRLSPVDADARLVVSAREITLEVFEGDAPLTHVTLAGAPAARDAETHTWSVAVPFTDAAMTIVAVDERGARFEGDVAIERGP